MSTFRRAPTTGGSAPQQRTGVLASLHSTSIVEVKPILPAELIVAILDYLPIPDLLRFARTSRRMREMVYDDTRWVARLKAMGVWNEQEARQRFEEAMRRKVQAQRAREEQERKRTSQGAANGVGVGGKRTTLFDAGWEEEKVSARERSGTLEKQFDALSVQPPTAPIPTAANLDPRTSLTALKMVRSIRGAARLEYGKIYGLLAPYYLDIIQSKSHTDPILFKAYRDPEEQAQMLAQVRIFAKSDFAQGWHEREEKLDSMIGVFENAVLNEFEQGYEANDVDGKMRRYAHVLHSLNGGAAGVDTFIHNHPLMVDKVALGSPLDCFNGLSGGIISLQPAEDFFRRLAASLNEQSSIIEKVFPPSVNVMRPFLDRITDEIISDYLTTLFDETHERNVDSYLRAVSGTFAQCLRFARTLTPPKGSPSHFTEDAIRIVARTFEPHIDLYLSDELEFFKKRIEAEVRAWNSRLTAEEESADAFFMSNVNRQAVKRDFMTSFKKAVMMPVNVVATIPSAFTNLPSAFGSTAPGAKPMPNPAINGATLEPPVSRSQSPGPGTPMPSPGLEAPTTELAAKAAIMASRLAGIKSLFSIEIALNLVHQAKASLERAALFVQLGGQSGEETKEQCEAIFTHLLQILGQEHVKPGFDKAVNALSNYNPRDVVEHSAKGVQPLVQFIELVNVGDLIQQMVEVFYLQELSGHGLIDKDDFLSPAVKEKKKFEQMLDERVAAGLNKGIDVLMDEVEYICGTTQLPTDFNPQPGKNGFVELTDIGPTETAKRIVELVSSHTSMLIGTTDKNMLDVFNQEVGVRLFTALSKHLKRQRISVDGAIRLISDTNHYHAYIVSLKNKSLTPYFSALRELSQIYLIDAKHAKEIATIIADQDRYYGIIRAEEVYEFAERRADWYAVRANVEKAMYGVGCSVM